MSPEFDRRLARVFEAIEVAARAHRGQFRKGTDVPYLLHPLGVARLLIGRGCPEDLIVAGVLHDTIEDTPLTLDEVRRGFGDRVAALVEALTEPDRKAPWESRKRHTVETLKGASEDVLLVSCADKLDNLREMRERLAREGEAAWSRLKRGRESQSWYYRSLAAVYSSRPRAEPGASLFKEFAGEVRAVFGDGPPSPDPP